MDRSARATASPRPRRLAILFAYLAILGSTGAGGGPAFAADTTGAGGGLAITTVDPAGTALVGACFELYTDAGGGSRGKPVDGSARCDQATVRDTTRGTADGATDGSLGWTGLPPAGYVIHQTLGAALLTAPAQYELAPDTAVTVTAGAVTAKTFVFRLVNGLTIRKVDAAGKPLTGSCFSVSAGRTGGAAACDGTTAASGTLPAGDGKADGLLQFPALVLTGTATTFTLTEIRAPDGYAPVGRYLVVIDPNHVTEATIVDTTTPPTQTGGGGNGVGTPIIGLQLEIQSSIDITKFQGQAVDSGQTGAAGTIALDGDAASGWHGTGSLDATTALKAVLSCQTITVAGKGVYDWVVRGVHAGPAVAAAAITVDMDSGPIEESPDKVSTDACGQTFDSTLNTWENLFFDTYRPKYQSAGFRVDGWTAVGGPEVWTSGGTIAEASWTGHCNTTLILGCTDHTTFKLTAVVEGTTSASPVPAASESDAGLPVITPEPLGQAGAGPIATLPTDLNPTGLPNGCTDAASCLSQYAIVIIIGAIGLLGGGLLLFQWFTSRGEALPKESLTAKIEPIDTSKFDTAPTLDAEKLPPIDGTLQTIDTSKFDTAPTLDAEKLPPIDGTLQTIDTSKFDTAPTLDADKVAPIGETLAPLEPTSSPLPPPPGSSLG
jgi:hypothetical protein